MRLSMNTLGLLILGALITFLIIMFITGVFSNTEERLDDQACAQSIEQHLRVRKLPGVGETVAPPIECKTNIIEVKTKKEEDIKQQLAEGARKCWHTWREGKESFFRGEDVFCHICSLHEYQHEVEINNFDQYLTRTLIPRTDKTYFMYLTPTIQRGDKVDQAIAGVFDLSSFTTSKDTGIIFMDVRGAESISNVMNVYTEQGRPGSWILMLGNAREPNPASVTETLVYSVNAGGPRSGSLGNTMYIDRESTLRNMRDVNPEELTLIVITEYDEQSLSDLGCTLPTRMFT